MSALQISRGGIRKTLWSVALGAGMAITAASPGQFGLSGGIGEAFRPAFTSRDVQLAVDILELDDAQKFILETLYEDYDLEFKTGVDAFRDRVSNMRSEIDPNNPDPGKIMRVVFGTINEWRDESRMLADQLTEDLQGLLNEEQLAKWPTFQRRLFRLKYLKNGQLPAENLDLLNDVRDLDLTDEQKARLQPILDQYEQDLDAALRRREQYLQTSQTELIDAIQVENYRLGIEVAARQVELRKGVRDVNEQYTAAIAAALPEAMGAEFSRAILQRTYPRVYRKTPAERAFIAAMRIEELEAETLEAITELETAYLSELTAFNSHLVEAIRQFKPKEIEHKVEQAANRLSGGQAERLQDPLRDEFAKRQEISKRYIEQLKSLLTPEQFAALPGARRWLAPDEEDVAARARRENIKDRKMFNMPKDRREGVPPAAASSPPRQGGGKSTADDPEKKKKTDD